MDELCGALPAHTVPNSRRLRLQAWLDSNQARVSQGWVFCIPGLQKKQGQGWGSLVRVPPSSDGACHTGAVPPGGGGGATMLRETTVTHLWEQGEGSCCPGC